MTATTTARRTILALLAALLVLAGAAGAVWAASTKPDFSVGANPTSRSIQAGQSATFDLTVTLDGFTGSITLSASGLPRSATATFTPSTVSVTGAAARSQLTIGTGVGTSAGSYAITVTGTSGKLARSVVLTLVVNPAATQPFALSLAPASASVPPGGIGVYTVTISRSAGFSGAVTLTATAAAGLRATVVDASASSATVQVATDSATRDGTYPITVTGTSGGSSQTVTAALVVDSKLSSKPFSLGGTPVGAIAPGTAGATVDLTVTNPNNQDLAITNLTVTVTGTSGGSGCGPSNFAVRQYAGRYPLTVPAHANAQTLTSLGAAAADLPRVTLVDLASNQDACKGATISLAYSGSAQTR